MSAWYLTPIQRLQQAAQVPPVIELPLTINQLARHAFKKLCKAIRCLKASPSDAVLHEIRILVKRARYAADLARWIVRKPAVRFIKASRVAQDLLGIHQDAIQAEHQARQFLKYSTSACVGFLPDAWSTSSAIVGIW